MERAQTAPVLAMDAVRPPGNQMYCWSARGRRGTRPKFYEALHGPFLTLVSSMAFLNLTQGTVVC